jgi:hypothetical protein
MMANGRIMLHFLTLHKFLHKCDLQTIDQIEGLKCKRKVHAIVVKEMQ